MINYKTLVPVLVSIKFITLFAQYKLQIFKKNIVI